MPHNVFIAATVETALVDRISHDRRLAIVNDLGEAEILVTRTVTRVDRSMLDLAPRLRLIAQGTSGVDNIDLEKARERGIRVVNLPGINANAVAELVIGLVITLTRTVPLYHREMLAGSWQRGDCATRHELRHHRLGIVGIGNVGSRVAHYAAAFGLEIAACDPYAADFGPAKRVASLHELLETSNVVTLHVPLTEETRRMIGPDEIASMRPGTILINAARGEVLDIDAALSALERGHLGGLAIDVFDPEPPERTWPDHPRLILTPHIAGCTHEAKSTAAERLFAAIGEFCEDDSA